MSSGRPSARSFFYWLSLIGLWIFVAYRFEVGCDWVGYKNIFEIQRYDSFADAMQKREAGYWLANALVQYLDLEYPYINVIAATVFFAGFHALATRQPDRLGFLILSFPVLLINLAMSANRQAMALGVLCYAFNAFVDRRFFRFMFLVALASMFHASAIFFLFLVPFIKREFNKRTVVQSLILALPGAYFFLSGDLQFYQERYVGAGADAIGGPFRAGLLAITGGLFLWWLKKRWPAGTQTNELTFVLIGSYLMLAVFPIAFISSVIGDRFGYYLTPIQLIILSRIPFLVRGQQATLVSLGPYMAMALVLVVWTQLSTLFQICYVPYQSWLFGL